MPLTAPPEDIYPDVDTAFASVQAHAKEQHMTKAKRRVFACDRAGRYDPRGKDSKNHYHLLDFTRWAGEIKVTCNR
jgi:hypothetical protein